MGKTTSFACRALMALIVTIGAAGALAQPPSAPPAPPERGKTVGGHIGIAVPLVFINEDDTETIGDTTVIANPIGVTLKMSDRLAVDFEVIVQNPVDPSGNTSLVVDPGVVYNFGQFAAGLRAAWVVTGAPANFGVIPLVNKGLVDLGGGTTWFVEAAFPMFVRSRPPDFTLDIVFHTGIGF